MSCLVGAYLAETWAEYRVDRIQLVSSPEVLLLIVERADRLAKNEWCRKDQISSYSTGRHLLALAAAQSIASVDCPSAGHYCEASSLLTRQRESQKRNWSARNVPFRYLVRFMVLEASVG